MEEMATIKFDSLAKPVISTKKQNIFSDIHLDIEEANQQTNGYASKNNLSDIKLDYDLDAIKNALVTLFNTIPGQNFMVPSYGLNLNQFVFNTITSTDAHAIGQTILNGINTFEPRVTVNNVNVSPDEDNNQYVIDLSLSLPDIGLTSTSLRGILTQNGFNF